MWFKVDDKLWGSPKWLSIPPAARALWVSAGSWSMDQLTDGHVPTYVIPVLGGTPDDAATLVTAGLWEDAPNGGYLFHDWHDYQPTRETVNAKRDAETARKKAWRDKQAADRAKRDVPGGVPVGHDADETRDGRGTDADVPAGVRHMSRPSRPDPTRPDPTTPEGVEKSAARKRATSLPASWTPTQEHIDRAAQDGVNLEREAAKFRLWADEGRTSKSWNGRFTRWLIQAADYAAERKPANPEAGTGFWGREIA